MSGDARDYRREEEIKTGRWRIGNQVKENIYISIFKGV